MFANDTAEAARARGPFAGRAGRTNRQIATELFIGEKTAGVHVSNILGKLGASRRTEAAAIAHRLRLLE
jgi:DNA-binding NarL/FixJ family response regulator